MLTRKDYATLLLIILLWAGNVVAIKLAVTAVAPLTAATLRFALGGLLFLPFAKLPDRRSIWTIFQIAMLMNVAHIGLLFLSLHVLDAGSASVLLQTQVIFATILGLIFFKETIRWRTWSGIGVAVIGVIVMLGTPNLAAHPDGVAMILLSTLALAFSYVKMKHLQTVHAATYICLLCLFAAPFTFAGSLILAPESWTTLGAVDWQLMAPVLLYQAVLVGLTHILWQRLMHRGDVGKITAFTMLIPFFTVLLSTVILHEKVAPAMIAGGLITMAGVAIITVRRIQKGIA